MARNTSLPFRLALVPILATLLLVALLFVALRLTSRAHHQHDAEQAVQADALVLARRIELDVAHRLTEVQQLARGLSQAPQLDAERLRTEIDFLMGQGKGYAWLGVAAPDGRVLAASYGWLEGRSLSEWPAFERGRKALWFGDFHPARLLKPYALGGEKREAWLADVAVPLFNADGSLRAVVIAELQADWLRRAGDEALDHMHSLSGMRWTLLQADGGRPLHPDAGAWPATAIDADAASAPPQLLQASRSLVVGFGNEVRWQVLVGQELDMALAPLQHFYVGLAGIAMVTLLLGGALVVGLMRWAARPYAQLLGAAELRYQAAGSDASQTEVLDRLGDELMAALPSSGPQGQALVRRLAGSPQQLQRTLDHLPMGLLLCDAEQRILHANVALCTCLGRPVDDLVGLSAWSLLLPAQADAEQRQRLSDLGDPPAPLAAQLELLCADGSRHTAAWQRVPLFDKERRLDGVLMLLQDQSGEATQRRRADGLQRRFAMLTNIAHSDAFVTLGADGCVLDWSQGATQLTGWVAELAIGRSLGSLLGESGSEAQAVDLLAQAQREGQVAIHARMRRDDGDSFIARGRLYRMSPDERDGDTGYALIFSDVTQAEEVALRVRESEARLAAVISGASDAIISTDVEGRVILFNPAAERIFGVTQAEMQGQSLDRLLPQSERGGHAARMAAFAVSEATRRPMGVGKVTGVRSDGTRLVLEAAISAARVAGRTVLTAILRDISERDRAEQRLVNYQLQLTDLTQRLLAQEKETTRQLAQSLHDELGQTLAAMRLMLDAGLQAPTAADLPPWVRRLDVVLVQANRQIREVLTELRPPLLDDEGLRAALDNERQQQQGRHDGVLLALDWNAEATQRWPAEVEYAAFMVAREALSNALRHAQASEIRLSCSGDGQQLRLSVIDNGCGDAELAKRQRPGHLGLVGMRERALAIGARLEFDSAPAGGTRVDLTWGGRIHEPAVSD